MHTQTQVRSSEHVRPVVQGGRIALSSVDVWPMSSGRVEWAPEQVGATMPASLQWVTR